MCSRCQASVNNNIINFIYNVPVPVLKENNNNKKPTYKLLLCLDVGLTGGKLANMLAFSCRSRRLRTIFVNLY